MDELTNDKVVAMFAKGEEFAKGELARLSFAIPSESAEAIQDAMTRLVRQINLVLGFDNNEKLHLRAR